MLTQGDSAFAGRDKHSTAMTLVIDTTSGVAVVAAAAVMFPSRAGQVFLQQVLQASARTAAL